MEKIAKFQPKTTSPGKILIPDEDASDNNRCTEHNCIKDDEKMRIQCHKCQRTLHYACTGLPPYQLNMFLNKGYRKYVCITCCSPAKELGRKVHNQVERIKSCTHSYKEIESCESIIKVKNESEKSLNTMIKDLQARYQEYIKDKNQVTNLIQSQFSTLETKLTSKIEETLNNKTAKIQTATEPRKKSFAEATKNNDQLSVNSMKQLLREEKIDEQIEDQRKLSTDANIIIHGVNENENKEDIDFVTELLNDVNLKTQPTYVSRVGKESKVMRPIKVAFKDSHNKYRFMKKLTELKQHEKYVKLSITDDLTKMEREQIKEWKKRADEMNKARSNDDFKWRVRGSPREKLYFKKIFCTRTV